jgi:hypothetical protein
MLQRWCDLSTLAGEAASLEEAVALILHMNVLFSCLEEAFGLSVLRIRLIIVSHID